MGWEGDGAGPEARGKRIRPLLVLLVASATGGKWRNALPAATAVELLHNFSLIHDDIEDNSPVRRGRPTVWKLWGVPQAVNAGDAMFTLAHMALGEMTVEIDLEIYLRAAKLFQETCLALTQGQYLDLAYEARGDLTLDAYWSMVRGKTAALLSACAHLGALSAGADAGKSEIYGRFGLELGMAFQAQDDLLGIWGDVEKTGKSAEIDLLAGKKTLPVLFGLSQDGAFKERWGQGAITVGEVPDLVDQLETLGARRYTQALAEETTARALQALEEAGPQGEAGEALFELTYYLIKRQM